MGLPIQNSYAAITATPYTTMLQVKPQAAPVPPAISPRTLSPGSYAFMAAVEPSLATEVALVTIPKVTAAWSPRIRVVETAKAKQAVVTSRVEVIEDDVDSQYYGDKDMGGSSRGSGAAGVVKIRPDELKRKLYSQAKRTAQRRGR